ncbi:hypothetical protein [Cohnella mopanensis]|uniref:hypothetical protein n=1 Tax=Cohnella mopanensis TaxID=2911966 RepID=UPI001EF80556|nr:hypothetical protein [Cohnella mopanensis]
MSRLIQLPQQSETALRQVRQPSWTYRYGYSRSAESAASGDPGQDYLSFAESESSFIFALCDGISMSYFGDIAAKYLGDRLIEWLGQLEDGRNGISELEQSLERYLKEITDQATRSLERHRIPSRIHGLLREIILDKKAKGSASMYGCGRIDLPCKAFPEGRIVLAWQGDIRLRVWKDGLERTSLLGDRFDTRQQWNSVLGPVGGKPNLLYDDLRSWKEGAVLLYSDGLKAIDAWERFTHEKLEGVMKQEAAHPSSDDISLLHIIWD